jgi:hypothetical protein
LAQLDDAIRQCQQVSGGDHSPDLVRSLANLFHRKAVQAEKNNREPDAAWSTCLSFWTTNVVHSQPFWSRFVEAYNAGRSRREQIKDDEAAEVRAACPVRWWRHILARQRRLQNRPRSAQRHLNLIWQWQADFC